ncbi:hypothetical protein OSTOST_14368 [Ostertagia ostertagi]
MLQQLSGRTHEVLTSIAVHYKDFAEQRTQVSQVRFGVLSPASIAAYVPRRNRTTRPAAYGIQGSGRAVRRAYRRAAIPASWGCRCTKPHSCYGWQVCPCPDPGYDVIRCLHSRAPMNEDILINITPQETRVALILQGAVQELHIERTLERGLVGNVYLGKVVRVLPGMQSAFIDIGLERAGLPARGRPAQRAATTARTRRRRRSKKSCSRASR